MSIFPAPHFVTWKTVNSAVSHTHELQFLCIRHDRRHPITFWWVIPNNSIHREQRIIMQIPQFFTISRNLFKSSAVFYRAIFLYYIYCCFNQEGSDRQDTLACALHHHQAVLTQVKIKRPSFTRNCDLVQFSNNIFLGLE